MGSTAEYAHERLDQRTLSEPRGKRQVLVRRLAEAAMSVTHHDASDHEIGYIHEVLSMEKLFTNILRGKLKS